MSTTFNHGRVAKSKGGKNIGGQLTMWALILMSVNIAGAFSTTVYNYINIGYTESPAFLVAIGIYLFPFTFVIIEFVSIKKTQGDRSGMMAWVKVGAGRKLAFLTAFMFWFANLTYFMGALPEDVNNMFFAFTGHDVTGAAWYQWALPFIMVAMFAFATYLSVKGVRGMGILITVGGTMFLVIVVVFVIVSSGAWVAMGTGAIDGYGKISEGGFYVSQGGITYIDSGVWMPVDSIIEFNNLEQMTAWSQSAYNDIITNGGSITADGAGKWIFQTSNGFGDQTFVHIELHSEGARNWIEFDHSYASAENPFIANPNLFDGYAGDDIIWGAVGGMNWMWFSTFVWVIMACDGMQGYASFADDVKGGRKNFSKALIYGALISGTMYTVGMFFVSVFPGDSLANASQTTIGLMSYFVIGNLGGDKVKTFEVAFIIVGWAIFISKLGSLLVWTAAPVRTLFSDADNGIFGSWITKKNEAGVPYRGAWIQFWIMVPLLVIPYILSASGTGDGVNSFMEMVKTAGGSLGMIPPMFIFFAYFNLRLRHDREERTFRMGSRGFGLIVAGMLLVVYAWIFFMSFFPYDPNNSEWWVGTALNTAALAFVFFPLLFYYLWFEYKQKDVKIAIDNNYDPNMIVASYSKDKKFFTQWTKETIEKGQNEIKSLKTEFDKKYNSVSLLDSEEEYNLKLAELDKEYIRCKNVIKHNYKNELNNVIGKIKEQGKAELDKLKPMIDKYNHGFKNEKKRLVAEFKKMISDIEEDSNININDYKSEKQKLRARQKEQRANDILIYEVKIKDELNYYNKLMIEATGDEKLTLKAKRDEIVANLKLDIINRKYYWKDKHDLELIELQGKMLGEKVKLKNELKHSIKWAKKHSYKNKIENLEIIKMSKYFSYDEYEPSVQGIEFNAIRSYTSDNKIKETSDKLIIEKDQLVLITREVDTFAVYKYPLALIDFIEDMDQKTIEVIKDGDIVKYSKFQLINYDQYISVSEDIFIENSNEFLKTFNESKLKSRKVMPKETVSERLI